MANAEGDDDVEDAEPIDGDNEAREMNDWKIKMVLKDYILWLLVDAYKSNDKLIGSIYKHIVYYSI